MTFQEWCDFTFYPGFYEATSGLTDDEYFDLEDLYNQYEEEELGYVADSDPDWP